MINLNVRSTNVRQGLGYVLVIVSGTVCEIEIG